MSERPEDVIREALLLGVKIISGTHPTARLETPHGLSTWPFDIAGDRLADLVAELRRVSEREAQRLKFWHEVETIPCEHGYEAEVEREGCCCGGCQAERVARAALAVGAEPQPPDEAHELPCPHGRLSWRSCPHCLGINRPGAAQSAPVAEESEPGNKPLARTPSDRPAGVAPGSLSSSTSDGAAVTPRRCGKTWGPTELRCDLEAGHAGSHSAVHTWPARPAVSGEGEQ